MPLKPPISAGRFGVGWLTVISTVCGSTASTFSTLAKR